MLRTKIAGVPVYRVKGLSFEIKDIWKSQLQLRLSDFCDWINSFAANDGNIRTLKRKRMPEQLKRYIIFLFLGSLNLNLRSKLQNSK